MGIEKALRDKLAANSTLNTGLTGRLYQVRAPENPDFPFLSVLRLDSDRDYTMEGYGNYTMAPFQIDLFGADYASLKVLARAVTKELSGFRGTSGGVDIQAIKQQNETDGWEDQVQKYRVTQVYKVEFSETI